MACTHKWLHRYCQIDYFEANKGDGGKGDTASTGYGTQVLAQSVYQKKDLSNFVGVRIQRDNAIIAVNLRTGLRNRDISNFMCARLAKPWRFATDM